jgi:hypothetical protein
VPRVKEWAGWPDGAVTIRNGIWMARPPHSSYDSELALRGTRSPLGASIGGNPVGPVLCPRQGLHDVALGEPMSMSSRRRPRIDVVGHYIFPLSFVTCMHTGDDSGSTINWKDSP